MEIYKFLCLNNRTVADKNCAVGNEVPTQEAHSRECLVKPKPKQEKKRKEKQVHHLIPN